MKHHKTILVTGGAGFIGTNLCERLVKEGHRVISLDNYFAGSKDNHVAGVKYREGHTKDVELFIPESPDWVFHLGEYARTEKSFEDIEKVWDLNKLGTFAVLEFCRKRSSKLIYAGSSTKFSDGGLGRDQSPYAWTKATNTELVKNYGEWFGLQYAIVYFYNVFGNRERGRGPYASLIGIYKEEYKAGNPLTVVSPGTQKRNFTHVDDIIEGLLLVAENAEGDNYGIGNDRSYSILDVAKLFGRDVIMLPERKGNRQSSEVDNQKLKALGWHAKRELDDDIKEFISKNKSTAKQKIPRIIVFSTTFAPISGPAEFALEQTMRAMPEVQFDVITTKYQKGMKEKEEYTSHITIHRVGYGTKLDKFLLPFFGSATARKILQDIHPMFIWSSMASYAAIAGMMTKRRHNIPHLITLADQKLRNVWRPFRLLLRVLFQDTDQIYVSSSNQEHDAQSLVERMNTRGLPGEGDAFANQIQFVYSSFLKKYE